MMTQIHNNTAIILRQFPYMEADLIVTFLTEHSGKLKGVAKYAKKSTRRFVGGFETGSVVTLEWSLKEGSELATLRGSQLIQTPSVKEYDHIIAVSVALDIVDQFIPLHQESSDKFHLVRKFIDLISVNRISKELLASFLFMFLKLTGFGPELFRCLDCNNTTFESAYFNPVKGGVHCSKCSPQSDGLMSISRSDLDDLQEFLLWPPPEGAKGNSVFHLADRILKRYILTVLEKPLKSEKYWAELGEKL